MNLNQFSVRVIGGREQSSGYVELAHGKRYALALGNHRSVPCDAAVTIDGESIGTFRVGGNKTLQLERKPGSDAGKFTFYAVQSAEGAQLGAAPGQHNNGLIKVVFTPAKVQPAIRPLAGAVGSVLQPWQRQQHHWNTYPIWPLYQPCYEWYWRTSRANAAASTGYLSRGAEPASQLMVGAPQLVGQEPALVLRAEPAGELRVRAHCGPSSSAGDVALNSLAASDMPVLDCAMPASAPAVTALANYVEGVTGLSGHSGQEFVDVAALELDYGQQTTIHLRLVVAQEHDRPRTLVQRATPVPPPLPARASHTITVGLN